MSNRVRGVWRNLSQSLGFIPGVIVFVFGVLGIVLVEVDAHIDLTGVQVVFKGDGPAARILLSVIAGSLITVAGLTFSITMVVLQLASTQFSPRILRTFFGDRITQITIGTFVGTFVYSILVLRAVGSFGQGGFVPRLSVTFASLFGIGGVVLLIVFLNHVSQMVQVSHVTAAIAKATLARTGALFPERAGAPVEHDDAADALARWRAQEPPGLVLPDQPGYVQRVAVEQLAQCLGEDARHAAILVCPGDFAAADRALVETWPASVAEERAEQIRSAIGVASERDLDQDLDFGVRQLSDTALKAMSPGINDPATAVTCVGYLRAILVELSGSTAPAGVRSFDDGPTIALRHRRFDEYLESIAQLGRYLDGDAWVTGEVLMALEACAKAAGRAGAPGRVADARAVAAAIGEQAQQEAGNRRDRERIAELTRRATSAG